MSIYSKNDQLPIDDGVETTEDCENIYLIERQLFLRAALQLLDERDSLLQNGASSSHNASSSSRTAFRSDVIRFGRLKKANKRNALSSMAPRVWKSKVVEIKYGIFYYEDETISKSDFIDNVWRKSIPLSASTTTCREVKGKGANANCIFQLSTTGGSKRTFLASSQTDRDAWIQAIYTAMSSCPSQASSTPVAAVAASVEKSLDKKGSFSLFKGATKQRIRAIGDSAWLTLPEATDLLALQSTSSLPGPAAKFAQDVTAYCAEQTKFTAAATAEDFQQAVHNLRDQRLSIRVPVFFVKSVRNSPEEANEFALASEDALSSSAVATLNSTQIWKDLQRDQVRVNGELVVGRTRGAEGIVAAVARHIMATAQTTSKLSATAPGSSIASFTSPTNLLSPRSVAEGARKKSPGKDVSSTSTLPSLNSSLSYISRIAKRLGASTNETESSNSDGAFHLSEAHALACAKEVLTMCNRTQSGGDTYFCVESLLAKCGLDSVAADRLCVLTPFDTESEPLEISLSVGMTATGTDVRELDGSSNNSDPLSLSPRNAPAKSSQLRHPSPDLASFPNAQAILDSEQDDRLGKRDSATTATTTTTDSLSTKYSLSASSSSSLSWLKKTLNPSQQALHMPAAGEDTSALASIRRKSNNSMISGIAGQLRRSSGVTESSPDGSPRKLKSDGINPALPSSSAIRISSSSSKMGSSIPVTIRQLSSDNLDIFNQEQASSVSPSAPSGLTQNLNRLSQRKALSTDSGDGDIDADEEADLFDRVDVSSVPDSDGGSGAGSLFELEDDDISVVSELVEELVDADGDLDSSTFISSEDHDTPSQRSTASLTKTASGGIVESHMVTGPGSPIDTRDDLLRRRLIAKSASAAVHPTTPSLASAMLGLPRSGEGRPKARFESESSLGPDAGDSVMEYEVKPRSALSLFKGKSFKIFEPLGGNHRSNSALGASAALEKSMSQLGASFRVQFPSDTPGDMVQRRKASLSGIYESQLSSLGQSRPPEVVIRILVKAESRYRLCCTDPQGDDSDHWASVTAVFQQVFVVYSDSNGAPTPMDRFVTLNFDKDIKKASKV